MFATLRHSTMRAGRAVVRYRPRFRAVVAAASVPVVVPARGLSTGRAGLPIMPSLMARVGRPAVARPQLVRCNATSSRNPHPNPEQPEGEGEKSEPKAKESFRSE
jgi:hypothetical protein